MATKRKKVKTRRSCKHGKLKRPVRTKNRRKRRCKKVLRKKRTNKRKRKFRFNFENDITKTREMLKQNKKLNDHVIKTIKKKHGNVFETNMSDNELIENVPIVMFNTKDGNKIKPYLFNLAFIGIKSTMEYAGEDEHFGIMIIEGLENIYIFSILTIKEKGIFSTISIYIESLDKNSDGHCLGMDINLMNNKSHLGEFFYGKKIDIDSCSVLNINNNDYNTKNIGKNIFSLFDYISLKMDLDSGDLEDSSDLKKMRGRCSEGFISLAPYLILNRGYTYYNARGFMSIKMDNNKLSRKELIKMGNDKLEDYIKYINKNVPKTFDTKQQCDLYDRLRNSIEKKETKKYKGKYQTYETYTWKTATKLYNFKTNELTVLDTSGNTPKFKMEKYKINF